MANILIEVIKNFFLSDDKKKEVETTRITNISKNEMEDGNFIISNDLFNNYNYRFNLDVNLTIENMNRLISLWRNMAQDPMIDDAIDEIINEFVVDNVTAKFIELNLDNVELSEKIKKQIFYSFDKIYNLLELDNYAYDIIKKFYVDGQLNVEVVYNEKSLKDGINELIICSPFNLVQFYNQDDEKYYYIYLDDLKNINFHSLKDLKNNSKCYSEEQFVRITSGIWSKDNSFPISFLNRAIKSLNQLNLIEDALVIFRITRSPEKRVFYIDVGKLPKTKAEEYVKTLIQKYRTKKVYNIETGSLDNAAKTVNILEDFWFPVSEGKSSRVETLSGANLTMDNLEDLKYFRNKVYKSLNIPLTRFDNENKLQFNNPSEIERTEIKFFKFILRLRNKFNILLKELMKRDLIARNILTLQDWNNIHNNIIFNYNSDNEYYELKKLSKIEQKINIASSASQLVDSGYLSIKYVQKNILFLSDEELSQIEQDNKEFAKNNPMMSEEDF